MRSPHLERLLGKLEDLDGRNAGHILEKVNQERAFLETVLNTAQENIFVIDQNGDIEYANLSALNLIGTDFASMDKSICLWKYLPDLAKSFQGENGSISIPRANTSKEIWLHYPQQRLMRVLVIPWNVVEKSQVTKKEHTTLILFDITEEKVTSEKLTEQKQFQALLELAAGLAHELGNPLNGIHIHLQLIERELNKQALAEKHLGALRHSLAICQKEVSRLDSTIENFLKATRLQKPNFEETHLLDALNAVLSLQAHELENLGIFVELVVPPHTPTVLADKNQLQQVFFNIVKNAMQAMTEGGQLSIKLSHDDEQIYLVFQDTGSGMDEETLAKVFTPFYSNKEEGHGLGMMVAQRIIRAHAGDIAIESEPSVGTRIYLKLPRQFRQTKLLQ